MKKHQDFKQIKMEFVGGKEIPYHMYSQYTSHNCSGNSNREVIFSTDQYSNCICPKCGEWIMEIIE